MFPTSSYSPLYILHIFLKEMVLFPSVQRSYKFYLPESIDYKGHHSDQAGEGTLPVVEDPQIGQHEGKT